MGDTKKLSPNPLKKGDVITLRLVVDDPTVAYHLRSKLLDTMLTGVPHEGYLLRAISNNDVFGEREDARDLLDECCKHLATCVDTYNMVSPEDLLEKIASTKG